MLEHRWDKCAVLSELLCGDEKAPIERAYPYVCAQRENKGVEPLSLVAILKTHPSNTIHRPYAGWSIIPDLLDSAPSELGDGVSTLADVEEVVLRFCTGACSKRTST